MSHFVPSSRTQLPGGIHGVDGPTFSSIVAGIQPLKVAIAASSARRRGALDPHHGGAASVLGSANDVGRHHDQQGRVALLRVVACQVVQAGNLADARRSEIGRALLLVKIADYDYRS